MTDNKFDLYLDLSYSSTGIFLINQDKKVLVFDNIERKDKIKKCYEKYFLEASEIRNKLISLLNRYSIKDVYLEIPIVNGFSAGALHGLSFLILDWIRTNISYNNLYQIHPTFINNACNKLYKNLSESEKKEIFKDCNFNRRKIKSIPDKLKEKDRPYLTQYIFSSNKELFSTYNIIGLNKLKNKDTSTAYLFFYLSKYLKKEFNKMFILSKKKGDYF